MHRDQSLDTKRGSDVLTGHDAARAGQACATGKPTAQDQVVSMRSKVVRPSLLSLLLPSVGKTASRADTALLGPGAPP